MSLKQITIVGLGLIGGSLAKALKKKRSSLKIHAYARAESTLEKALKANIIHEGSTDIAKAVKHSDVIIFCTPLSSYAPLLSQMLPHLKPSALISDVGSAKQYVIDTLLPLLSEAQQKQLVPAHPIAGAEKSGLSATKQTLFQNKRLIITPAPKTAIDAIKTIQKLWMQAGANVEELPAKRHDNIYATVSHTPQLLAFAYNTLLSALDESIQQEMEDNGSSSYWQFRRIAASPTAMWDDIFAANRVAVTHALDKVTDALKLSASHFAERPQDFARNYASLNVLEHGVLLDNISQEAFVHLYVLPVMISRALHAVAELYLPYAGTGFADFTNMHQIPLAAHEIPPLKDSTLKALSKLFETIASYRVGL